MQRSKWPHDNIGRTILVNARRQWGVFTLTIQIPNHRVGDTYYVSREFFFPDILSVFA